KPEIISLTKRVIMVEITPKIMTIDEKTDKPRDILVFICKKSTKGLIIKASKAPIIKGAVNLLKQINKKTLKIATKITNKKRITLNKKSRFIPTPLFKININSIIQHLHNDC